MMSTNTRTPHAALGSSLSEGGPGALAGTRSTADGHRRREKILKDCRSHRVNLLVARAARDPRPAFAGGKKK